MKKTTLIVTSLLLVLILSACGGKVATEAESAENANTAPVDSSPDGDFQFEIPAEMALMLGTVKLDETVYAVDADQASELLPLWKALRSLGESETAAQAEIDAVIAQIEDTLSPEQMDAIEEMDLSMQDFASVAETLGIETAFGAGRFGEMTPEMQATVEAARESGEFSGRPGGDFPDGGFGPGGGQGFGGAEMDPDARATAIAQRGGTRGVGLGINTVLLDAIIEFLTAKTE